MTKELTSKATVVNIDNHRMSILDWALAYAERGVKVFATTADGKAPATSNKAWSERLGRELRKGEGGLNQATTDPDTIRWMFSHRNAGGIGMPCGAVNNVIVLDLDLHKENRDGNAHTVQAVYWDEIEEAHTVTTKSGGIHAYFAYEPDHAKGELGANVDVQSDGAYVLLPPSKGYRVLRSVQKEDWQLPPWPATKPIRQRQEQAHDGKVPDHIKAAIERIRTGSGWHNEVRDVVAHLVGSGWSDAEILRYSFQWTWSGYNPRDTFETLCVMIEGARAKGWGDSDK